MKKIIAIVLTVVMVLALACGCKKDEPKKPTISLEGVNLINEGYLTLGCEIGYPPFEMYAEDGKTAQGIDVDIANAIGEKLGLEIRFVDTLFDVIFAGLDVNYDAVISAVTITPERQEEMLFTDSYIDNYQAVVIRADDNRSVKSFNDLNGMVIGVQKGTTSDELMSDYKSTGSIDITLMPNEKVATCFKMLENKEIDAVVVDSSVANRYIGEGSKFVAAYIDQSEPERFAIALSQKNTALQEALNKALAELKAEGELDAIINYWLGTEE